MAIGLEVVLDDGSDRDRIERDRAGRTKTFPPWRAASNTTSEHSEPVPIMVVGPPRGEHGREMRMVLYPVPLGSPAFGPLATGDRLVMELDGQSRGQATVSWVNEWGEPLAEGQLEALVLWQAGGPEPGRVSPHLRDS